MSSGHLLRRILEHNRWGNVSLVRACAALTDEQLDATPRSPTEWTLRQVLVHLLDSEAAYVAMISGEPRAPSVEGASFADMETAATASGDALLALAADDGGIAWEDVLRTSDGYDVDRWIILVQAVNHGTEHRRQMCSLFRAQDLEPPYIDGWGFGESVGAVVKVEA